MSFVAPAYSNYINLRAREKWMVMTIVTGAQGHVFIRDPPPHVYGARSYILVLRPNKHRAHLSMLGVLRVSACVCKTARLRMRSGSWRVFVCVRDFK